MVPEDALILSAAAPAQAARHGVRFERGVAALFLSLLFLALNAFFVAAEFALVKVHATRLDRAARHGDRRAIAAQAIVKRLDRYLSVTQFGITVASLGLGWIAEPAIEEVADSAAHALTGRPLPRTGHIVVDVAGLGLLTFLHLLLGELVPKFVAIKHAEATTLNAALPLRLVNAVFAPILWVLEKSQRGVLKLIRIDPDIASEGALSEEEIVGILAASVRRAGAGQEKQRVLERVLRLTGRPVRQMMVPRVDVVWVQADATVAAARRVLAEHQFSRVLAVNGSLDEVAGYLYAKDLLLDDGLPEERRITPLVRRPLFVPESQNGFSALQDMKKKATPFAVVVDEYGGTSGIVTLEDLVEEIVGDIRDELDPEEAPVRRSRKDPLVWEVDADATLDELRDAGVPLDEDELAIGEPVATVVHERLGHVPRAGDVVRLAANVVAEVISIGRRRIRRLRLRVRPS